MKLPSMLEQVLLHDTINFVLTNRVPRRLLTRFMGWFSRIEQPQVRDASIAMLAMFAGDLRLDEAKKPAFASLHDCFVRELKEGARPVATDRRMLVSPCDGIVGAAGTIEDGTLLQAKGSSYALDELLGDPYAASRYRGGRYVTLRLTTSMYHRFHAPCHATLERATYVAGDLWNVNPSALRRVAGLYCRNERAILHARTAEGDCPLAIVAVGAILVGSIHLHCVGGPPCVPLRGLVHLRCGVSCAKGDELGYFHHGSTIIVVGADGLELCGHLREGAVVRMGEPLLRRR